MPFRFRRRGSTATHPPLSPRLPLLRALAGGWKGGAGEGSPLPHDTGRVARTTGDRRDKRTSHPKTSGHRLYRLRGQVDRRALPVDSDGLSCETGTGQANGVSSCFRRGDPNLSRFHPHLLDPRGDPVHVGVRRAQALLSLARSRLSSDREAVRSRLDPTVRAARQ